MNFSAANTRSDVQDWRTSRLDIVNDALASLLEQQKQVALLQSALKYVVLSPGKRFRPLIALALANDSRGESEEAQILPLALSIELLHCASLVHDDLPALDNDALRRGQKTCHIEFNEATAILVGDYLVPLAFDLVCGSEISSQRKVSIAKVLSSSFMKLCSGQQLDLLTSVHKVEPLTIARLKTGALFAATMALPLIALGYDDEVIVVAEELGLALGLAFQIADDFNDHWCAKEKQDNSQPSIQVNLVGNCEVSEGVLGEQLWSETLKKLNELLAKLESVLQLKNRGLPLTKGLVYDVLAQSKPMPAQL